MIKTVKESKSPMIPMLGKIHLGDPKPSERAPGRNSDKFRFELKVELGEDADLSIEKILGEKITEMKVLFPRIDKNDDQKSLAFIFDANYKLYKEGKAICVGDGETATRINEIDGVKERAIVGCTCKFFEAGQCKQQGDLRISPVEVIKTGNYGFFHVTTTSWNAIRDLYNAISHYYEVLGPENFWKTPFILYKRKVKVKPKGGSAREQYIMALRPDPVYLKQKGLMEELYGIAAPLVDILDPSLESSADDSPFDTESGDIPQEEISPTGVGAPASVPEVPQQTGQENEVERVEDHGGQDASQVVQPVHVEGSVSGATNPKPSPEPVSSLPVGSSPAPSGTPVSKPAAKKAVAKTAPEVVTEVVPEVAKTPAPPQHEGSVEKKPTDSTTSASNAGQAGTSPSPSTPPQNSGAPKKASGTDELGGTTSNRTVKRNKITQLFKQYVTVAKVADMGETDPRELFEGVLGLDFDPGDKEFMNAFLRTDIFTLEALEYAAETLTGMISDITDPDKA
jgi:hypothetical protein